MERVVVIGSGLSAVSALKRLVEKGIKPLVLDCGKRVPEQIEKKTKKLSNLSPSEWTADDRKEIMTNPTVFNSSSYPKKLSFGSDYFYSKSFGENFPPSSQAYGGFSVGWGSSSLPADNCDMNGWPIKQSDLLEHYKSILDTLPYSACDDGLSEAFPLLSNKACPLRLSKASHSLLQDMQKKSKRIKEKAAVFGQSRLLIEARSDHKNECRYCGSCMSGCAYGSIYKASDDLNKLIEMKLVDYRPNVFVQKLIEEKSTVKIIFINEFGSLVSLDCSRVFLGAGVVNSARIVAESKEMYNQSIPLLSTLGFIVPMGRIKRAKLEWPNINTEPGIFMEYKVPQLSNHWVHSQLTPVNELALIKLKLIRNGGLTKSLVKKRLFEHLVVATCNMHSDHGVECNLRLNKDVKTTTFEYSRGDTLNSKRSIKLAGRKLFSIMSSVGCYPVLKLGSSSIDSFGYHLGGSLPMKSLPTNENHTNILGSPKGWSRVHVIDSSTFPSIPGTTIGLIAMANARRIVDSVIVSKKTNPSKEEAMLSFSEE